MGNYCCSEESNTVDDDDDVTTKYEVIKSDAFISFQRGANEEGVDILEIATNLNAYFIAKGFKTLFEQDKLNIDAIGMSTFVIFPNTCSISFLNRSINHDTLSKGTVNI